MDRDGGIEHGGTCSEYGSVNPSALLPSFRKQKERPVHKMKMLGNFSILWTLTVSTPYWNKHLCKTGVVSSNNDGEKKRCQKHFVQNDSKGWIFYHEQWWMNRSWVLLKHLQLTHQWCIYRTVDWFRHSPPNSTVLPIFYYASRRHEKMIHLQPAHFQTW